MESELSYHVGDLASTESNVDSTEGSAVPALPEPSPSSLSSERIIAESGPPKMPIYLWVGISRNPNVPLYALERTEDFDAIFWVQASDVGNLYKGFCGIAEALGLMDEGDKEDMVICRDKVLQWLCNPRKQQQPPTAASSADTTAAGSKFAKWLIIFDGVDDIDIVSEFWPLTAHGSILMGESIRIYSADPRPQTLFEHLGYLPLAISQIAAQVRRDHTTFEEYLRICNRKHESSELDTGLLLGKLNKVKALPPREQYRFTVSTAWKVESFSRQTLCLLCVMVFMDHGAVAESILQQTVDMDNLDLEDDDLDLEDDNPDLEDELRILYPWYSRVYFPARAELLRTSLVSRNTETAALGCNKLVQEVVRAKMTPKERYIYYQIAVDLLCGAWESASGRLHRSHRSESLYKKKIQHDQVLPHVLTILAAYDSVAGYSSLPFETARRLLTLLSVASW
ncbi:predicted protein [Chaetomium globosum CBS 148.51]|uniref:DUF7779 domain-containing protein n=1 Tax=Chaetomium globosum (strain ATCC 6205 / CBS 148.51 / DSM 1962 / NBRC 6347 / NRRL 1970) TaxID=306901 RepID=Q2H1I9_CHAGB|nr:uncharacterized protein CHGG_04357 [Chaetomium globosum CBS 148.51]EAQ87738.1 predicted protein [Chaetomium globosum CBS 148.51]